MIGHPDYHDPVPFDHPIEVECDCGHHNVLDPDSFKRLMSRKRFTCAFCGRRRLPISALRGATVDEKGEMVGLCPNCAGADDE